MESVRQELLALGRLLLGLAAYLATLSLGCLIANALYPAWSEVDPSLEYVVFIFPGGILHFIMLILLFRIAVSSRIWWHSCLFAALCGAIFAGFWCAYFS